MTFKDLMIETIMTATGQDRDRCVKMLMATDEGRMKLSGPDKHLTKEEVAEYRDKFSKEMPGILAWLARATMISQPPKGSA